MITEHSIKIKGKLPQEDVNSKMEVFYNPVMVSNRNISILLLNAIPNKNMKLALPLAGSGIRGLRFLTELKKGKIKQLCVNDKKDNFPGVFKENLNLSNLNDKKVSAHNEDATLFLLHQDGFDYIDIDPFGSPNPFLAASIARISRKGILAVTATDTAALTGTYPKVTKRKYWAKTQRNYLMHEIGLRILIRKIQLQGIQFDKALTPVLAYHKDHYFRIYFAAARGKERCDELIKQHQYLLYNSQTLDFKVSNYNLDDGFNEFTGPLWTGKLFDLKLVKKMAKQNAYLEEQSFLNLLKEEAKKDFLGFYDLHMIAKKYKIEPPRMEIVLKKLKGVRTHFSRNGIKTEKTVQDVVKVMKSI